MTTIRTALIALPVFLFACGGGGETTSGLDRSQQASALSPADQTTLCEATTEARGGAGETFDCGDDVEVTVDTVAECVSGFSEFENCSVTVADLEDCANAGSSPCDIGAVFNSEACGRVFECAN